MKSPREEDAVLKLFPVEAAAFLLHLETRLQEVLAGPGRFTVDAHLGATPLSARQCGELCLRSHREENVQRSGTTCTVSGVAATASRTQNTAERA
eukprot:3977404-Alexandrium_andersonii.AAC.1